jgi:hypothetical protein
MEVRISESVYLFPPPEKCLKEGEIDLISDKSTSTHREHLRVCEYHHYYNDWIPLP